MKAIFYIRIVKGTGDWLWQRCTINICTIHVFCLLYSDDPCWLVEYVWLHVVLKLARGTIINCHVFVDKWSCTVFSVHKYTFSQLTSTETKPNTRNTMIVVKWLLLSHSQHAITNTLLLHSHTIIPQAAANTIMQLSTLATRFNQQMSTTSAQSKVLCNWERNKEQKWGIYMHSTLHCVYSNPSFFSISRWGCPTISASFGSVTEK